MNITSDTKNILFQIENEILTCTYKKGLIIDLATAKKIVSVRLKISEGKSYPLLIDVSQVRYITRDAREYFNSKRGREGILAVVILVSSLYTKFMGTFFLKISYRNPSFPAKIFMKKGRALQWLAQYKGN